jgi:CheY-like chemotaxis protein
VSETPAKPTTRETIVVVEDEVLVRMVIAQYLRDCGYRVFEAVNADEAVAILEDGNIDIDVVFSDVAMPGRRDGFALATWVRRHRPAVDVILTGTATRVVTAAAELCEEGPLSKPYHPHHVLERIKRLVAARKKS